MSRRVPIHDHSDLNSGGLIDSVVQQVISVVGTGSSEITFGSPVATGAALADGGEQTAARAGHVHTNAYLGTVLVYGTAGSAQVLTAQGAGSATWAAAAGGGSVSVYDESAVQGTVTIFDFVGAGVSAAVSGGTATITISGGTTTASIITQDEGSTIGTASVLNFTGSGGTASYSGGTTTINITGGISSGTAFPGSPGTADRFFRTDRGLDYYYDGTRWVTVHLYREQVGVGDEFSGNKAAGAVVGRNTLWGDDYDLYMEKLYLSAYVATTNSGAAYWVFTLQRISSPTTTTTVGTVDTSTGTANSYLTYEGTLGTVVSKATTNSMLQVSSSKVGSPGNVYYSVAFTYRLVG